MVEKKNKMPSDTMLIVYGSALVLCFAGEPMFAILWVLLNAYNFIDSAWRLPAMFLLVFAVVVYKRFFQIANSTK